jgi:glycosyltransferase 2 family protein
LDDGVLPSTSAVIATADRAVRIGRLIGWAAVAASLGFIGLQLWQHAPWRLAAAHADALAAAIIGGALLYGVAGFFLSSAWYQLLSPGSTAASIRCHHAVYGRTQIAKYLPGNVFHLIGRQVLGRRLGHGQARLALASLLEALLLVLTAAALSLPLAWRWLDQGFLWIGAVAAPVLVLLAVRWSRRHHQSALCELGAGAAGDWTKALLRLLRAGVLYALFFLVVAAIFWTLVLSVSSSGRMAIDLAGSVPVVALAWLAGFVTPGSSAGIGVREALLIAALEGTIGAPASALIALALRLVTVGGDVLFFALGMTLRLADVPAQAGNGPARSQAVSH